MRPEAKSRRMRVTGATLTEGWAYLGLIRPAGLLLAVNHKAHSTSVSSEELDFRWATAFTQSVPSTPSAQSPMNDSSSAAHVATAELTTPSASASTSGACEPPESSSAVSHTCLR